MYTIEGICLNRSRAPGQEHSFYFMVRHPRTKAGFPHRNFHCWVRHELASSCHISISSAEVSLNKAFTWFYNALHEPLGNSWSDVFISLQTSVYQVFISLYSFFFFFLMDLEATTEKKYTAIETKLFSFWGTWTPTSSLQVTVHSFSLSHTHKVMHIPPHEMENKQISYPWKLDLTYIGF